MNAIEDLRLPVLEPKVLSDIAVVGKQLGNFNPFDRGPTMQRSVRFKDSTVPCLVAYDRRKNGCVYWLSVAQTQVAMDFIRQPVVFQKEIFEAPDSPFWCVEMINLYSEVTGQGYGSLIVRLADQVLQQISNHNKTRLYVYRQDGSDTGWTTAMTQSIGYKLGRKELQSNDREIEQKRPPLYKWFEPKTHKLF